MGFFKCTLDSCTKILLDHIAIKQENFRLNERDLTFKKTFFQFIEFSYVHSNRTLY